MPTEHVGTDSSMLLWRVLTSALTTLVRTAQRVLGLPHGETCPRSRLLHVHAKGDGGQ
jgi:hypothetical protein